MFRCFAVFALAGLTPQAAFALDIARSGSALHLSGRIVSGDDIRFREALAAGPVTLVTLDSGGGAIGPAREIARAIRTSGATTVIDASRSRCASACTVIFAGGRNRHYVNAAQVKDGVQSLKAKGLGYHEGNDWSVSGRREQSGRASANLINAYYELGSPSAAEFVGKAGFKDMYYVSGATALAKGLATSLAKP
jgi:hypothetical protein